MVILLQLSIFLLAVIVRGRFLLGWHLSDSDTNDRLTFIAKAKYTVFGISSGYKISARHIGLSQHNGLPFIIRRERWYHRSLKNLGIASEIKISDTRFDKKYFIITDYPTHLEQALASGELLTSLKKLFALPVRSLHATPHRIWCVIRKDDLREADSHYNKHTEILAEIAKASVTTTAIEAGPKSSRKLGAFALAFISLHAGLLTLGVLGAFPTFVDSIEMIDMKGLVYKGALFGALAASLWLLAILSLFKGSSWASWVVVDFIMCGIAGFILTSMVSVREANIHLPQPPAQIFEQPITQKICTLECEEKCGRRCTRRSSYTFGSDATCSSQSRVAIMREKQQVDSICASKAWFEYTLAVKHWRDAPDYAFEPSYTLFDSVRTGALLKVPVHEGALGLQWVDTSQIVAK